MKRTYPHKTAELGIQCGQRAHASTMQREMGKVFHHKKLLDHGPDGPWRNRTSGPRLLRSTSHVVQSWCREEREGRGVDDESGTEREESSSRPPGFPAIPPAPAEREENWKEMRVYSPIAIIILLLLGSLTTHSNLPTVLHLVLCARGVIQSALSP